MMNAVGPLLCISTGRESEREWERQDERGDRSAGEHAAHGPDSIQHSSAPNTVQHPTQFSNTVQHPTQFSFGTRRNMKGGKGPCSFLLWCLLWGHVWALSIFGPTEWKGEEHTDSAPLIKGTAMAGWLPRRHLVWASNVPALPPVQWKMKIWRFSLNRWMIQSWINSKW